MKFTGHVFGRMSCKETILREQVIDKILEYRKRIMKNGIHSHICKYCHLEFECAAIKKCHKSEIDICYERQCIEKAKKEKNE